MTDARMCEPTKPRIVYGELDLLQPPFTWEIGGKFGSPELVQQVLQQQLQDGEIVTSERASNRTLELTIMIRDNDLGACALAEAQLALEAAKPRNTLAFDPGDGFGPVTVFDTFVGSVTFERDDDKDVRGIRDYLLEIPALPYARSRDLITIGIPAPPPDVISTVVDDGSSLTGWAVAPSTGDAIQTFTASGSWTAPDGITTVFAERLGGGGGGAVASSGGAGGGGGAYSADDAPCTPGTTYTVTVGAGGAHGGTNGGAGGYSQLSGPSHRAAGGSGASGLVPGAGGTVAASTGTTRTAGVAGSTGTTFHGGAGGNGANPLGGSSGYGRGGAGANIGSASNGAAGKVRLTWDGDWKMSLNPTGIKISKSAYSNAATWLERTGLTADLTDTPYIQVTTLWGAGTGALAFSINGTPATIVAQSGGTYWLDASTFSTLNSLRIDISTGAGAAIFYVQEIVITNSLTAGSTGRQNARQVTVAGSARSQASLSLSDIDNSLGSALIYTTTNLDANQPPLRPWLIAGPTITPDGTLVSGESSDLGTQHIFDLPILGVASGGYLLVARVNDPAGGSRTFDWEAFTRMGATNDEGQSGAVTEVLVADTWMLITVGIMNLPTSQAGPSGKTRITLQSSAGILLDEAWLFNLDTGRLTWVECGSDAPTGGGSSNRLWLDTASVEDPKPSIWRGTAEDRSDSINAGADTRSWGAHEFVPPAISVFSVTTDSTAAELTLQHYPRWHTHAAL